MIKELIAIPFYVVAYIFAIIGFMVLFIHFVFKGIGDAIRGVEE